ncbi:hypothetical protein TRFO_16957 [Tritrichomonas foetus]|uniref:Uncharacterized protein n=1 Tax=Tritrichomonas foetus TaxID=1144522 RepID=A0A1J4KP35_9EUKA|nr:hypothetical protein TRFO_16957 [Tritrichomonas foetus]|eukprot:OHT12995.1 hypothetical protein TRFO_16957 [Tritrichomonas foetus]
MSHQGGKSAAIFSSVFPNVIRATNRYFLRIIKYMRSILPPASNAQIHKSEIFQKMGYFPYGNDTYVESTQKLVTLGKTNPDDAIEILTTMNPFSKNPTLYNTFLEGLGCAAEESQVIQRFLQLSAMYIFADTIPQILSFVDHKLSENSLLLDAILQLINSNVDYYECREPFRSVFDKHWRIIIKQCSVIIGLLSIHSFDSIYPFFTSFIKNINQNNAQNIKMYRFIRIPPSIMKDHSFLVVDTIKHHRRTPEIMKPLISYLRYVTLQTDDGDTIANILVAKNYAMKFPDYKQHTTEIDAIITSKKPNLSIDNFIEFITKLFSEVQPPNMTKKQLGNDYLKPKIQLRCFLYLLRGSKFDETFFWRKGEINGRIDPSLEREYMWNPTAPVSRIFSVFKPFFEKIDNPSDYLVKAIFENFAMRNVEQTISTISLFLLNSSESKTLVLLQTLSYIALKHSQTFNETTKSTLFTMLQKYTISEISSFVISPPVLLENQLSSDLDPNYVPEPSQFIAKLVTQADEADFYIKKQLSAFEFKRCVLSYQQNIVRSRRIYDKITIWLISLLSKYIQSINSLNFIQILIQLSFSSKYNIALFSLYTLEYLYLKFNDLQVMIIDAILKELLNIDNDHRNATFMALLEHLLKRKFPSSPSCHFNEKLETIIFLHLASPFVEIRILCLSLAKLLDCPLFSVQTYRIQSRFPEIKLPILKFEEICESSCLLLYSIFYSEVLINIKNPTIINTLKSIDVSSHIRFPPKIIQLTDDKVFSFQRKILLSVMHYCLYTLTKSQYENIQKDLALLSPYNFLTCYSITKPFLISTNEESDALKKVIQYLLQNQTPEIVWPFEFLLVFANTASFHHLSLLLTIIVKQMKSFENKNLIFLTNLLTLLKNISQLPDVQLLFAAFPNSFNCMKEFFVCFESYIKKTSVTSLNDEIKPLILIYAKIIKNVSNAITAPFDAGLTGSIHAYRPYEFTYSLNWTIEERFYTFMFFQKVANDNFLYEEIHAAVVALLHSGPVFRKHADFRGNYIFVDECLSPILQYHSFLFPLFSKECFSLNSSYFRAICEQFVGNRDDKLEILTKREIKANSDAFSKRAILLLLAFLFSKLEKNFHDICLKLMRRIASLTSALVMPNDNSKIIKINQASNVLNAVFESFPFVASDVFIEGMNQIKIGVSSPVASQILDVLCQAALQIDLNSKAISFVSHLVELYHSISRSFDSQYCKIFLNFCINSEPNRRYLQLALFPLKRIEATKLILSSLIRHFPDSFVPRVIQTTKLGSWFYYRVLMSEYQSSYSVDCCVYLMKQLCETHFSALVSHLTHIIHFCLLFYTSVHGVPQLLNMLGKQMKVDICTIDQKDVDFSTAVPALTSYFTREKVEEWEHIALIWYVSCGDLQVAMKSGEIFALLPAHKWDMITPICRSIHTVFSCPSLKKHSVVFKYPVCGLNMICSILQTAKVPTKVSEKLFTFLCAFIGTPDTKIICTLFKIFSVFVENSEMVETMNLLELYLKIVRYLNPSNDLLTRSASLFLVSVIINVPDAKIRAVTFCLLLPIIYSSLSGSNLDVKTTDEILKMLTSAQLGGTLPTIIADFVQIRESPALFLGKIINDLYVNHLSDIECIGSYYASMCSFEDASAVFEIVLNLFNVSDKDWFIENFIGVVKAACKHREHGLKLLAAITEKYRGAMFTWEGALKQNDKENCTDLDFSFDNLVQQLTEVSQTIPKKKVPNGEVSLSLYETMIPMIPLVRDSLKYYQESLNEVKQMTPQPLTTDTEDYIKLKQIKTIPYEPDVAEQSLDIFEKHIVPVSEGIDEKPTEKIPVEFFIPDNLDEFYERLI